MCIKFSMIVLSTIHLYLIFIIINIEYYTEKYGGNPAILSEVSSCLFSVKLGHPKTSNVNTILK